MNVTIRKRQYSLIGQHLLRQLRNSHNLFRYFHNLPGLITDLPITNYQSQITNLLVSYLVTLLLVDLLPSIYVRFNSRIPFSVTRIEIPISATTAIHMLDKPAVASAMKAALTATAKAILKRIVFIVIRLKW